MSSWRAQLLVAVVCLILGLMLVPQFRSQRTRDVSGPSLTDQASYISSLSHSNLELQREVDSYKRDNGGGNLESLVNDIERYRIANGEVDIVGPGVRVTISQSVDVRHLQDAVNEVRSAGIEGMAVNDIRLLTRSAITADASNHLLVDKQQISPPYVITAIGNADTLEAAANRKGGLFDLWRATEKLTIHIEKVAAPDTLIKMPKTALEQPWRYAKPAH